MSWGWNPVWFVATREEAEGESQRLDAARSTATHWGRQDWLEALEDCLLFAGKGT